MPVGLIAGAAVIVVIATVMLFYWIVLQRNVSKKVISKYIEQLDDEYHSANGSDMSRSLASIENGTEI